MSGIFNPKNAAARPLNGSVLPRYRALSGSVLPRYTPIQKNAQGEYFMNGATLRGLGRALGAGAASTIPGACWDVAGFKDCHATWFAQAQKDCQSGDVANFNGDMDTCTDVYADQYAIQNCVPKFCASTLPTVQAGGLTAAQVIAIQKATNAALAANGYKPIAVDGKLGPATCGACLYMLQNFGLSTYKDYNLAAYCKTWTNPTKVGSTVPDQTVVLQESDGITIPVMPGWGASSPTMPALQQQINASLDAAGYLPSPVTGVLDAKTCGAMQWMKQNMGQDLLAGTGANCQAFILPTKKPASQSPSTAPKGSAPPTVAPPAPVPPGTHPITSAGMLMVGGLALLGGGAYWYAKKKGMV